MNFIDFNGKLAPSGEPVITADNRGFRYGDGLFETMRIVNGIVPLLELHRKRMLASLALMEIELPEQLSGDGLPGSIRRLATQNNCTDNGRVRLAVFRGTGSIYDQDTQPGYLIEARPLSNDTSGLNANGLVIDAFPHARKSCDRFSSIKSANYLPYVMGARYAMQHKLDDSIILNTRDRIADTTIANIFIVKGSRIITPPLSEGCVDGVMRRYLLENLETKNRNLTIAEEPLTRETLLGADEVFLTNAVNGISWVAQCGEKNLVNTIAAKIYHNCIQTIFKPAC